MTPSDRPSSEPDPFWDQPEIVERFAAREPDARLGRLIAEADDPTELRVLDLGCAAGRNTLFLAERGVPVVALDASPVMVAHTRERVRPLLGEQLAAERVGVGVMSDLGRYDDDAFDLVVVLGVMHTARSIQEWNETLGEIERVVAPGGRVLVSNFSPASEPEGEPLPAVYGTEHLRRWRDDRPMVLMDAEQHDMSFGEHGFRPLEPTETVRVPLDRGFRVTVNGLYGRID